jgi:putative hydrolase of the HAD superfamily
MFHNRTLPAAWHGLLGINCKPAAMLGMKAIKVSSEAQALEELQLATGLRFS